MKTLREYIDQLDEISRRDFLKGAGAAAAGAVVGQPQNAKAAPMGWAVSLSPAMTDVSDPPINSKRKVKLATKYYDPKSLPEEQKKHISDLINLLYVARMTPDDYRDSQGGRVISGGVPSRIYQNAYDLLIFINDSFMTLNIAKAMNQSKAALEKIQKEDPARWQAIQQSVLNRWLETIGAGNALKQALGGESPTAQQSQNVQPQSSSPATQSQPAQPVQSRTVPDATMPYEQQLGNHIKRRINYAKRTNENPEAVVQVEVLPTGELRRVMLTKPSGDKDWDRAVENAILKSSPLPLRRDGTIPSRLEFTFRPQDVQESEDLEEASPDAVKRIEELVKYK